MSVPGADDESEDGQSPQPPSLLSQRHEPVYAPTPVNVSAALWAAVGVLLIAGGVLILLRKDRIIADLVGQAQQQGISAADVAEGTSTALWVLLIGLIAYAGLLGLFAYKAREGTRSARAVLTVLTVLLVLAQFPLFPNVLTVASAVVAVAALVLMYLPSVAQHYPRLPKSLP